MKTYQSSAKDKKSKNFLKRHLYAILLGVTVLAIGLIITLTLVFTLKPAPGIAPGPGIVTPDPEPPVDAKPSYVLPVSECTISKEAAINHLVFCSTIKQWRTHNGIDMAVAAGSEVFAVKDGTVKSVQNTNLEGVVVTIEHADGITSVYKSLENVSIKEGQAVAAGDKLGAVAASMMLEHNDGTHLHFEMLENGKFVDPLSLLPVSGDK